MLKGKKFQSLKDQKVVSVLEENGVWVTLDDSTNIKTDVFLQKYTEFFEPDNFFTHDPVMERLAQQFNEKININTTPIVTPSGIEMSGAQSPAGIFIEETPDDIERKKRELLNSFQNNYRPPVVQDAIDMNTIGNPNYQPPQQFQKRERGTYIPPESTSEVKNLTTGEVIVKANVQQASYSETPSQPASQDIYKTYEQINNQPYQPPVQHPVQHHPVQQPVQPQGPVGNISNPSPSGIRTDLTPEQEAFMFFKKFKKIHPIDVKLIFKELIADPTYLRQTAMNFDGDIVKFYTNELMNKLWDNPSLLEKQIYDEFKKIIIGETDPIAETIKPESYEDKENKYVSPGVFVVERDQSEITDNVIIPEKVVKINGEYE